MSFLDFGMVNSQPEASARKLCGWNNAVVRKVFLLVSASLFVLYDNTKSQMIPRATCQLEPRTIKSMVERCMIPQQKSGFEHTGP